MGTLDDIDDAPLILELKTVTNPLGSPLPLNPTSFSQDLSGTTVEPSLSEEAARLGLLAYSLQVEIVFCHDIVPVIEGNGAHGDD